MFLYVFTHFYMFLRKIKGDGNGAFPFQNGDNENNNKLSNLLPEHIKFDESNKDYLVFTDMIGQHFDDIWEYINALSDTYDRRDKLDEGLSKDLLYNVAQSLGWNLNDGKDLLPLSIILASPL